jgi:hypothetical protein
MKHKGEQFGKLTSLENLESQIAQKRVAKTFQGCKKTSENIEL